MVSRSCWKGFIPEATRSEYDGEAVLRWLDMVGLDPEAVGERLVLTPSCGLAGATPAWAQRSLALLRKAATHLSG